MEVLKEVQKHENQLEIHLETLEEAMRKFYKVRRKIEALIDKEDEDLVVEESKDVRKKWLAGLALQREQEYNKATLDVEESSSRQ